MCGATNVGTCKEYALSRIIKSMCKGRQETCSGHASAAINFGAEDAAATLYRVLRELLLLI